MYIGTYSYRAWQEPVVTLLFKKSLFAGIIYSYGFAMGLRYSTSAAHCLFQLGVEIHKKHS